MFRDYFQSWANLYNYVSFGNATTSCTSFRPFLWTIFLFILKGACGQYHNEQFLYFEVGFLNVIIEFELGLWTQTRSQIGSKYSLSSKVLTRPANIAVGYSLNVRRVNASSQDKPRWQTNSLIVPLYWAFQCHLRTAADYSYKVIEYGALSYV